MDFKKFFINNKAVSPVIGVILMVAITVILAAAIGSTVFGQGTAQIAPQANIHIQAAGLSNENVGSIKVEHLGGDPIDFANSNTKILASVNGGSSVELTPDKIVTDTTTTLSVGEVRKAELKTTETSNPKLRDNSGEDISDLASGDTVNIKIIDVKTNQLICDRDLRF
ncbi:type IV pilin [Methanosarcina sp. MSH10X1]|uniref:type IV pilin n=1 Tax=Methanosarcina sp. MSH10X1 TaxID=2507075 RepID=UPI000FFB9F0B|nr:type IV pilin [Methanosarcina sp. MSH10X1]RXA21345.1 type IV pilin [Methanosarcina sp. MSH10X1]